MPIDHGTRDSFHQIIVVMEGKPLRSGEGKDVSSGSNSNSATFKLKAARRCCCRSKLSQLDPIRPQRGPLGGNRPPSAMSFQIPRRMGPRLPRRRCKWLVCPRVGVMRKRIGASGITARTASGPESETSVRASPPINSTPPWTSSISCAAEPSGGNGRTAAHNCRRRRAGAIHKSSYIQHLCGFYAARTRVRRQARKTFAAPRKNVSERAKASKPRARCFGRREADEGISNGPRRQTRFDMMGASCDRLGTSMQNRELRRNRE